jgi:uncharacterized protein (DUF608 family)
VPWPRVAYNNFRNMRNPPNEITRDDFASRFSGRAAPRRVPPGERKQSIDLGLALLSVLRHPNETLTYADIAVWCDCTPGFILLVEQKAFRKLRRALECRYPELAVEFRDFFSA